MPQYTCFSAVSLFLAFLVRGNYLSRDHGVTETGLDNLAQRRRKSKPFNESIEPPTASNQ